MLWASFSAVRAVCELVVAGNAASDEFRKLAAERVSAWAESGLN